MSYDNGAAAYWPEDVPPPYADPDVEGELEARAALQREERRLAGVAPPPPPADAEWEPGNPIALALWRAMPTSGRGVEYWRLVRSVAGSSHEQAHVQLALLGLVLIGRAYVTGMAGGSGGEVGAEDEHGRVGVALQELAPGRAGPVGVDVERGGPGRVGALRERPRRP